MGSGMAKGIVGLAGLPGDLQAFVKKHTPWETKKSINLPTSLEVIDYAGQYAPALKETPKTVAGEYGQTVGEFLPLAGRRVVAMGVAPAVASEAAGQLTKGTEAEPYARLGGAVLAAGAPALASRGSAAERALASAARDMTPAQIDAAVGLFERSRQGATPVPLTLAEAAGNERMLNLQRVVEGQGGLSDFMAQRPGQVQAAGRTAIDTVAPVTNAPSMIGPQIGEAAQSVVADANRARTAAVSPHYTAAAKDTVPQDTIAAIVGKIDAAIAADKTGLSHGPLKELRNTLVMEDAGAAKTAPAAAPAPEAPVSFGKVEAARRPQSLMEFLSGFGLAPNAELRQIFDKSNPRKIMRPYGKTLDQALEAATEAGYFHEPDYGVRTHTPDDLLSAIRDEHFGKKLYPNQDFAAYQGSKDFQAYRKEMAGHERAIKDALPIAGWEDDFLATAAGKDALSRAADYLRTGEERNPRAAWDRAVNEFDQFSSEAANAAPPGAPPAAAPQAPSQKFVTDVENLDRVKKFFRDKMELPAFAEKAIDKETGARIGPMLGEIDSAMSAASPQYARGKSIYEQITRDTVEPLMAGPIGKLADKDLTTRNAINALFPQNPVPNSAQEVLGAVSALSKRNATAARQLVRAHVESVFNQATRDLQGGPTQFGGATFKAKLTGNPQQAANLAAAIRALPNGKEILAGFDKMLEIMAATGRRQRIGSQTAFNAELQSQLKAGSIVGESAATGGVKLPQRLRDAYQAWNLGRNVDQVARLLTDPAAVPVFRALASSPPGSAKAVAAATRLAILSQSSNKKERK